jgi:threonyl-tRNA synthetase
MRKKFKNAQAIYLWYLFGVTLWTADLTGRVDGFAPSNLKLAESNLPASLSSLTQRDELQHLLHQRKHACSTPLSRRMSVSIDSENAINGKTTEGVNGSGENVFTIRRTAAMVMSIAVQKVIPGAVQSGSMGPAWIEEGFYCDFAMQQDIYATDEKNEYDESLKSLIKEEVDSIIASAEPIVMESVSVMEAKKMIGDNQILSRRLEDMSDDDTITVCRIGEDWCWLLSCDNHSDGDKNIVLASTDQLDPDALALTSVRNLAKRNEETDTSDIAFLRLTATAFKTQSDLLSYKTKVDESQRVVKTFGGLVNWGSGSLDDLEYMCPCCDPMEDNDGYGLNGLGLMPATSNGYGPSQPSRAQKTRLTEESGPKIVTLDRPSLKLESPFVPAKNPEWLSQREVIYDTIRERREAELALKPTKPIEVTLPDGTVLGGDHNLTSWRTTPLDVARCISDGLANVAVVSRVRHTSRIGSTDAIVAGDGMDYDFDDTSKPELWDLTRPLEGNCNIEILTFNSDDDAAKAVFWHSSAHLLGQSLEHNYGALLTIGPPVAGGFYYDAYMGDGEGLSESQFGEIEDEFRKSVKRKEKFERLVVTKDEALDLFSYSPFKTALIKAKVPDNTRTTVYRNGDLIDLCMGPHVPHTGKIKAFKMLRCSAASWLGDADNDQLQRVYGVSFPTKKLLKAHLENLERARERDHRRLGIEQKLFIFHKLSPGSAFFLPHGTIIYNTLCEFIRTQYRKRGYSEVVTPNVFNLKLWEQSGHAKHYKEDMFIFDVEGEEWGMKPMNCPAHCLMFGSMSRSYRELPMRIADFGVLHRNEQSGALTGLTRVRRFQQDDGHIFCREDQIEEEVLGCLEFMKFVYETFGMTYKLELSTRPKKALGEKVLWDRAEAALASAMDNFAGKGNWRENPGDGAFYGPKIDIKVMDAMDRVHQCATIQLDFQLPIRFDLRYRKKGGTNGDDNSGSDVEVEASSATTDDDVDPDDSNELPPDFARPVMVHRAMLGSVERMFAVLLEHYGGKWPFWLSPRQALVVPVGKSFVPYANKVVDRLRVEGFHVDIDDSSNSLKKKVREGQLAQYNYILVVGEKEETNESVAVRNRNNEMEGEKKVDEVIAEFRNLRDTYQNENIAEVAN